MASKTDGCAAQLKRLVELTGTQAAVARLLGKTPSRISEWQGDIRPHLATRRLIGEAVAALEALLGQRGGNIEALRSAIDIPVSELAGARPSDLIRQGRGQEIVAAFAVTPAADREPAERELIDALIALAAAAGVTAQALESVRAS